MKTIIQKIKYLIELVGTLKVYGEDPNKVLKDLLSSPLVKDNILDENKVRNILTGLTSEVTHAYAVSTGRKLVADTMLELLANINKSFAERYTTISKYGNVLDTALRPIDEVLTSDAMVTRWASINGSKLYQDYFMERLDRDFLTTINSSNWGVDFVLTMEKLVIIYKYYIVRSLEDTLVSKLDAANEAVRSIADMATNLSDLQVVVSSEVIERASLPKNPLEFKCTVPIYSQQEIGKLIKELAVDTPNIDQTNDILVLPSLELIQKDLDKVYQKLEADVNVVKNVLETGYPVYLKEILEKIYTAFSSTVNEFIGFKTTDENYDSKLTNLTNLLIKLVDIDNTVTEVAIEVSDSMSTKVARYLSLFQLYNMLMAYSMDIRTVNSKVGPK